jgi:4-amino-4-deoxy-L-arabinose transferase-like glycosyltransferase
VSHLHSSHRSRYTLAAVLLLVAIGGWLRVAALGRIPLPAHQDEVSEIYDSYSILTTGADRSGVRHPIVLRALGDVDYRPAMYAWLATVPMSVSGFSVAAGRLPSAILGVVSLVLIFLVARRLSGEKFALLALLLAALSPWHIAFSRLAHEGSMLPPFFVILCFWLWMRAADNEYRAMRTISLGFAIGLSTSSYQTLRLIAPVWSLIIMWDIWKNATQRTRSAMTFAAAAFVGALPQIIVLVTAPDHFFGRANSTLLDPTNPATFVAGAAKNFAELLAPTIMFWPGMVDTGLTSARLLPIEASFFYLGILTLWMLRPPSGRRFVGYTYALFLLAMVPAVITHSPHSIRVSAIISLLPLFSATGFQALGNAFKKTRLSSLYYPVATAGIVTSFVFVALTYIYSPKAPGQRSNNALVNVGERLKFVQSRYDSIFVTDSASHPDLYIVAFSGMTPAEFQRAPKVIESRNGWDVAHQIGKYFFLDERSLHQSANEPGASRTLFISRTPIANSNQLDSAFWFSEKYYFSERRNRGESP